MAADDSRTPDEVFFTSFALSMQRALWGVIPSSLQAVALGSGGGQGLARFVFDDVPGEDEVELMAEVETEVVADFPASASFVFTAVQNDIGTLTFEPGETWWAYVRAPRERRA